MIPEIGKFVSYRPVKGKKGYVGLVLSESNTWNGCYEIFCMKDKRVYHVRHELIIKEIPVYINIEGLKIEGLR